MQIRDLSNKITSAQLNESLAKKFGYRLSLNKFTEGQLTQVHQQLSEKVNTFERTNSFDSVVENHEYQKNRAMLDVIRQEIKERTLSDEEKGKKEKYVKGMKKASGTFKKKYGEKGEEVMHATATKMAKKESVEEAMEVLRSVLSERTLTEGEEEKAALIMSARDMVDRVTGWLEDVASMKTETMLDLVDSIRDELGNDISEQFSSTVKPTLDELYNSLESSRTTLAQAVAILTGEEGPGGAAGAMGGGMDMGAEMPATIGEPDMPEGGDEFGAAAAATGGEEAAGRMRRESIEYSRKLGKILISNKK
jgi:DNA-binding transcriptional regulator GbsR (MarR family)